MEKNNSYSNKKRWKHPKHHGKKNFQNHKNTEPETPFTRVKLKDVECAYCGKIIEELSSALSSKEKGEPVHFDCVLNKIKETEKLSSGESITYIGQGRFGVIYYENPHDIRHFKINRIIEWEDRDSKPEWRQEIIDIYAGIK